MPRKVVWEIHGERIIDEWSVLINSARGKTDLVFQKTMKRIEEEKIPIIQCEMVVVEVPRLSRALKEWILAKRIGEEAKELVKGERNFLMVTNLALHDYKMYIGARDYGGNLQVSWYLTCEPNFFKKALSTLTTGSDKALSFALASDPFYSQDLEAFVTLVHHCLLETVSEIMQSLGQDPSKIDRKSKGFLGVS